MGFLDDVLDAITGQDNVDDANAANQKRLEEALAFLSGAEGEFEFDNDRINQLFGAAKRETRKGRKDIRQSSQKALQQLAGASISGRQALRRREASTLGRSRAILTNRGLSRSSAAGRQERGIRADTNQGIGELESSLAGLRSGVVRSTGGQLAQQQNILAQLLQRQAGMVSQRELFGISGRVGLARDKANILGSVSDKAAPGLLSQATDVAKLFASGGVF